MYSKTTHGVTVTVESVYLEEQSEPEDNHYVWAYHVTIKNGTSGTIQLRSRFWRITDTNGAVIEIEGEGVVGEQPVLEPGASYSYTSGTPLQTPGGIMAGAYRMTGDRGVSFSVEIPAFSLDSPGENRVLH